MEDLSIIDRFTETFSRYIDSGFGLLSGDVAFLTTILVGIDITLAGLFWALHGEDNVLGQLIKKVLYVGFFALLLNNFKSLADFVFQSFAGLGLKATGVSMTAADLMRPGFVASAGFTASRPLIEKAGELIGITSFFTNFVTIVVLMLAWLIVLLAFFVLAVQLFITIGLVSGAPQLGAGAAVATTAGLGATAIAGGMLATGGVRAAGRLAGSAVRSAASLTGTVGAGYESGGMSGVARATIAAPVAAAAGKVTTPVRDAYRQGAAAGYRANAPGDDPADPGRGADVMAAGASGAPANASAPEWAQRLSRRQRLTQASLIAGQTVREGDRPTGAQGPDLKNKS